MNSQILITAAALFAAIAVAPLPAARAQGHSATATINAENVQSITYDLERHELCVRLLTGRSRVFLKVPEDVFSAFVNSSRPGLFYEKAVRGQFSSRRVKHVEDTAGVCPRAVQPST